MALRLCLILLNFVFDDSSYDRLGTDAEIGSAWVQQHTRTFAEGFASQVILIMVWCFFSSDLALPI